uniref:Inner membrane protein n=1 Tax=Globodera pallida TaxID=36090 RepID=A0A183BMK2_GLOPA
MLRFYPIVQWIAFALVQDFNCHFTWDKEAMFCFCGAICAPSLVGWVIYAARKATQSFADVRKLPVQ